MNPTTQIVTREGYFAQKENGEYYAGTETVKDGGPSPADYSVVNFTPDIARAFFFDTPPTSLAIRGIEANAKTKVRLVPVSIKVEYHLHA